MVEIAICLAIIGIALVAIIGVLPIGMRTQRDNREETIINQDATVFTEAIRGGARGLNDLTNYVYAITNYWTKYDNNGVVIAGGGSLNNGYNYSSFSIAPLYISSSGSPINSGTNIIGLLSTPEYTDNSGVPIPGLMFGGYSNHVVAYVRSLSGPAVEKPPQDNAIIQAGAFGYRILCVNAPIATALPPVWVSGNYANGNQVLYNQIYLPGENLWTNYWMVWQAITNTAGIPGQSSGWAQLPYVPALSASLRELRLTFLWPQLPNGNLGAGRQTFRTMVTGQMTQVFTNGQWLYFYQPQSFINAVSAQ